MATSFLTEESFSKNWEASKLYMEDLRKPYDEFERIKNNRPHPDIDPAYPKTTDGTTAAQVRQVPRRVVQQVPFGKASVKGDAALSCLSNFILQEEIIPNSDIQGDVLSKTWKAIEDDLTYGHADALIFYKQEGDYFGTDWRIPYVKDVYLEAGKGSFSECNYFFVRAWYKDSDIQDLIDKEESLAKSAKERGEEYEPVWTVSVLKELQDSSKAEKDEKAKTDSEKDRGIKSNGYEIIHGFQKGMGAKFMSFAPAIKKMAREWKNPDPRGVMPGHRMYFESDLSNPEGRGVVELVAPLQNFIDGSLQAFQYVRALMYNPPLLKKGNYNRNQIQFRPNAVIDLGNDENNSLNPLNLNNSAITNFSSDYSLFKSQILNIFGGDDQTISATAGNPGFSKTSAGVNARQGIIGVNDNYVRRRVETWLGDIFCTQLNIYFAVTQGDREFVPSEKEFEKLAEYGDNEYFTFAENKIIVHFDAIQDKIIDFETEASTSKAPDTNESKEKLLDAVKTAAEVGLLQYTDPIELTKRIFGDVEDAEKLVKDPATLQAEAQEQAMTQEMPPEGEMPMEAEAPQEELSEEDKVILDNLTKAGYPPEIAIQGLKLEKQGYTDEQIDQVLGQMMQGAQG